MGDWRDSVRSRQSEKPGAVRVCRKEGGMRGCTALTQLVCDGFILFLDTGRLMGDRYPMTPVDCEVDRRIYISLCRQHQAKSNPDKAPAGVRGIP